MSSVPPTVATPCSLANSQAGFLQPLLHSSSRPITSTSQIKPMRSSNGEESEAGYQVEQANEPLSRAQGVKPASTAMM